MRYFEDVNNIIMILEFVQKKQFQNLRIINYND